MKYSITVRKVEETDLSIDCPSPETNKDEYLAHLSALVEDINLNPSITHTVEKNGIIDVESSLRRDDFWETLKPLFEREKCYIKFVIIDEIA